jgi:formylglycine-generating enzyme required for sulfatase activity
VAASCSGSAGGEGRRQSEDEKRPPVRDAKPRSDAAEAWDVAERTNTVPALEAYIRRFGDTYYGDLAKARLAELKEAEAAVAARKKADPDAQAKERDRIALLEKQREDERRAKARDPALSVKPGSGESFRDCDVCPEMVVVPAGSFTMGSPPTEKKRFDGEGPQHRVTFPRAFAVGKFEVTFDEWDACVDAGGCRHRPGDEGWGRGRRPVINVSWDDITKEYLPWLSGKTGKTYRLLTEAEWEYAARAGTITPFSTGRTITTAQANFHSDYTYGGGAKGIYRGKTVEVGSFQPNAFGLYDLHGNVWEWVQDCWNDSYRGAPTDGSVWRTGDCSRRVLRGGSWGLFPWYLRSALRYVFSTVFRYYDFGFRVGRTLTL